MVADVKDQDESVRLPLIMLRTNLNLLTCTGCSGGCCIYLTLRCRTIEMLRGCVEYQLDSDEVVDDQDFLEVL